MGKKNLSTGHSRQQEELSFRGTDGFKELWEHRQGGMLLPRQLALRDSEAGQKLQEQKGPANTCGAERDVGDKRDGRLSRGSSLEPLLWGSCPSLQPTSWLEQQLPGTLACSPGPEDLRGFANFFRLTKEADLREQSSSGERSQGQVGGRVCLGRV